MSKCLILAIAVELIGIAVIGIGIELARHADAGWATVTVGSCLVAIGGVSWAKFFKLGKRQ